MGSSLMMAALHNGDATYLKIPQNVAFHHRSAYLEALLSDKTKSPISTFAFAYMARVGSLPVESVEVFPEARTSGPRKTIARPSLSTRELQ